MTVHPDAKINAIIDAIAGQMDALAAMLADNRLHALAAKASGVAKTDNARERQVRVARAALIAAKA